MSLLTVQGGPRLLPEFPRPHELAVGEPDSQLPPAAPFRFSAWPAPISPASQDQEHDDRRIADRSVLSGEVESPRLAIHAEDGDVVTALVAAIEKLARRVKVETAG